MKKLSPISQFCQKRIKQFLIQPSIKSLTQGFNDNCITNALRRIRNAWHFYHALILVIYVVCGNIALRCSPLKRALCLIK
ncbi:DUF3265 domain-containing protein [Vibrio parahaemolyticus]|nr:DUF3265 domain-containing protein [Vibrio parahaemolyticus]